MIAFRRILVAGIATLLVAGACTSVTLPSIPPINIPSIPPINIPSGGVTIPTFPPINLPSGGIGNFTLPPIALPSGSIPCTLVTAAEVSQIFGGTAQDLSESATNCTFFTGQGTVSVTADSATDLSGVQFLMGQSAQQTTVGGFPAIAGNVFGLPALYVQKPSSQLQILGFLGTDLNTPQRLAALGEIAVTRIP